MSSPVEHDAEQRSRALAMAKLPQPERVRLEMEQEELKRAIQFCAGLDRVVLEQARQRVIRDLPAVYATMQAMRSRTLQVKIYRLLSTNLTLDFTGEPAGEPEDRDDDSGF